MQGNGKVFEALDVSITQIHLSPDYKCSDPVHNQINEMGRLNIFELLPTITGLPRFLARWDEKANQIDIEIEGVSANVQDDFEHARRGYKGHWSKPAPTGTSMYTYDICIEIPTAKVFEGTISFTARRKHDMQGTACISPPEEWRLLHTTAFCWR